MDSTDTMAAAMAALFADPAFVKLAANAMNTALQGRAAPTTSSSTPADQRRGTRTTAKGGGSPTAAAARGGTTDIAPSGDSATDALHGVIQDLRDAMADLKVEMAALREENKQHRQWQQLAEGGTAGEDWPLLGTGPPARAGPVPMKTTMSPYESL